MPAYWLTFKPFRPAAPLGWPIEDLRDLVARFEADPMQATQWWRFASHSGEPIGARVYLFKQDDNPQGVFGVRTIIDGPEERESPSDTLGRRWRVLVRFEKLVDPTEGFLLGLSEIDDIVPKKLVDAQANGTEIRDESVVTELERRLAPWLDGLPIQPDQADDPSLDPDSSSNQMERALRAI